MSLRSPIGHQLDRLENLSHDSNGNKLPSAEGFEGIRCKETRAYAPAVGSDRESIEERMEREGREANQLASLTPDERRVLEYQGKLEQRVEHRILVADGKLADYLRDGYTLDPLSERLVERQGMPAVVCVEVIGYERMQTEKMDYAAIASMMNIGKGRVHEIVREAHRKLREATRR